MSYSVHTKGFGNAQPIRTLYEGLSSSEILKLAGVPPDVQLPKEIKPKKASKKAPKA
jgi:hypothetical protein